MSVRYRFHSMNPCTGPYINAVTAQAYEAVVASWFRPGRRAQVGRPEQRKGRSEERAAHHGSRRCRRSVEPDQRAARRRAIAPSARRATGAGRRGRCAVAWPTSPAHRQAVAPTSTAHMPSTATTHTGRRSHHDGCSRRGAGTPESRRCRRTGTAMSGATHTRRSRPTGAVPQRPEARPSRSRNGRAISIPTCARPTSRCTASAGWCSTVRRSRSRSTTPDSPRARRAARPRARRRRDARPNRRSRNPPRAHAVRHQPPTSHGATHAR